MLRTPNFLEYIMEGCDLTMAVAVDFTSSNKNIDDPASLHYVHGGQLNQYQDAMLCMSCNFTTTPQLQTRIRCPLKDV